MTVMIVDHDASFRQELIAALRITSVELIAYEADSAESALLQIDELPIQLLIADVTLPGISGIELAMMLRAKNNLTKMVLLSIQLDANVQCIAELLSIDHVLTRTTACQQLPELLPAMLANLQLGCYGR